MVQVMERRRNNISISIGSANTNRFHDLRIFLLMILMETKQIGFCTNAEHLLLQIDELFQKKIMDMGRMHNP